MPPIFRPDCLGRTGQSFSKGSQLMVILSEAKDTLRDPSLCDAAKPIGVFIQNLLRQFAGFRGIDVAHRVFRRGSGHGRLRCLLGRVGGGGFLDFVRLLGHAGKFRREFAAVNGPNLRKQHSAPLKP